MNNVEGHDDHDVKPVLKPLDEPLVVCGFVDGRSYKLVEVNGPLVDGGDGPEVGEAFSIRHVFKPYAAGIPGYEHLVLFIGRKDRNYIRFFKTVEELRSVLEGVVAQAETPLEMVKRLGQL